MRQYYMSSWAKVVESMGTSIHKGLMEYDCIIRREQFGDNTISLPKSKKWTSTINRVINKYNILIGLIVSAILLLNKEYTFLALTSIFWMIDFIGKCIIFFKENKKVNVLQNINSTDVVVLREGIERLVKSDELVKGDIVIFKQNSFIAADIRIISSDNLVVDERNITGNIVYKKKNEITLFKEPSTINELDNMLFKGTLVKEGQGTGVVVEVGNNTVLGNLYSSIKENINKKNIYEIVEKQLVKLQSILMILLVLLYIVAPGKDNLKIQIFTSSIFIVSSFSILVTGTLYYKRVVREFKNKGIILNDISAITNSSEVKVLFINKKGSITENELLVRKFFTSENYIDKDNADINEINMKRLLDIAFINSDIYNATKELSNDMYSEAYTRFIKEKCINKLQIVRNNPLKFRVPFESDKKIMTTVVKTNRGYRANSRGALEEILNRCTYILVNGVERHITQADLEKIKLADLYFSREGLLSEACAYRSFNYEPTIEENVESNLVFVGLIASSNTLADNVKNDIESMFDEGVLPIIICDDNKIFAEILGRKIGLISGANEVTSGVELSYMADDDYYKAISRTRVYCRLTPSQKDKIISTYVNDGFKVAVEGKDLGDVSTITISNLGIAKENAPLVLKTTSDITSGKSTIKTLLDLRKQSKNEDVIIDYSSYLYIKILLLIITALFSYYVFGKDILFSKSILLLLSIFIVSPIVSISLIGPGKNTKSKLGSLIISITIIIVSVYLTNESIGFIIYALIALISMIDIIFNIDIDFKGFNKDTKVFAIVSIFMIIGIVIAYFIMAIELSIYLLITIGTFSLLYFTMVLFSENMDIITNRGVAIEDK